MRAVFLSVVLVAFSTGKAQSVNKSILDSIKAAVKHTHTDQALIMHNNTTVFHYKSTPVQKPINVFSITKSFTSLAIGFLIAEGKIHSTDTPLYHFYPELNQGLKRRITVKDLLVHTSGLQDHNTPLEDAVQLKDIIPDLVQYAIASDVTDTPGIKPRYNNNALMLLSGLVKKLTGMSLEHYLQQRLFKPLAIKDYFWDKDSKGHTLAYSELHMQAEDLAKIGQMILDSGYYQGRQILPKEWLKEALFTPHVVLFKGFGTYGYLWWQNTAGEEWIVSARGYLGNWLIIIPSKKIVAVRLINERSFTTDKNRGDGDAFFNFLRFVSQL